MYIKKVVTIGGGTGSYTVLSGLKKIPNIFLSALVSMSDDGGSTGVLRDELGVLPAGDVRQCLVALSDHTDIVRNLMNYRFHNGSLVGHNFGNIFLAALEKVTGSFSHGVLVASEILQVNGRVVPITNDNAKLLVSLKNGELIIGQANIANRSFQDIGLKKVFFKKKVKISDNAKQIIKDADYIIIGPGDYYGSLVPNYIVSGFKDVILNTKAKIILPINLTNRSGHTLHWKASDYLKDTENYIGRKVDYILINNKKPSDEQIKRYLLKEGNGVLIKDDLSDDRVIRADLISHTIVSKNKIDKVKRSFIRHDSDKIAFCIENLMKKDNNKFIFDFDDVLFKNTLLFKKHMFSVLEKNHIPYLFALKQYNKIRTNKFSLKSFITLLFSLKKIKHISSDEVYEEIMSKSKNFVDKKMFEIVQKVGKANCYIVSSGDDRYQMDKIIRSGFYGLFKKIYITGNTKKSIVEKICKENLNSSIYFIDDKMDHFKNLDAKKYNNLHTILFNKDGLKKINNLVN